MQLRDDGNGKVIPYPNMWNFLGGGVEAGETHIEAAVREIEEETRITIDSSDLAPLLVYDHDQTNRDHVFVCRVPEDTVAERHEGAALEWLSYTEISQLELAFEQIRILPELKRYLEAGA